MSAEHLYAQKCGGRSCGGKADPSAQSASVYPGIKHLHRLQDRIRQFRADSVMDLSLQAFQLDLRIAAFLETLEQ